MVEGKKKELTVKYMKEKYTVPEKVKAKTKEFVRIKKIILKVLESGNKTIPQISKETKISSDIITYNLMSLIKYGNIKPCEMDDMDEYYFYELKNK